MLTPLITVIVSFLDTPFRIPLTFPFRLRLILYPVKEEEL